MNGDLEAEGVNERLPWPMDSARGQLGLMVFGGACGLALAFFTHAWIAGVVGFLSLAAVRVMRWVLTWRAPVSKWDDLQWETMQWETVPVEEFVSYVRYLKRRLRRTSIELFLYPARLAVLVWVIGAWITWTTCFAVWTQIPWLTFLILCAVVGFTVGFVRSIFATGSQVAPPPLCRTARLLKWVLPQRLYVRCVAPLLGDHQREYFDTLNRGQVWRARWLVVVCYIALGSQLTILSIRGLARMLVPSPRDK